MNKNRIAGTAKQAKGVVKEALGKVTGNVKLRAKGRADKIEGTVQKTIGKAKDAARGALRKFKK